MEQQILLVMLGSAATCSLVAAGPAWRLLRRSWPALVALAAALLIASRLALDAWPSPRPAAAIAWWPHLALAAVALLLLVSALTASTLRRTLGAAIVGAIISALLASLPLAAILARLDTADRLAWRIGLTLGSALLAAATAAAFAPTSTTSARPPLLHRLRDHHWATFALGLVFALSTPAILVSAHSIKHFMLAAAIGVAWGSLALFALFGRLSLALAAPAAVLASAGLWVIAHFTSGDVSPLALAGALLAPGAVVIGTFGPLARRAGWTRFITASALSATLAATPALLHGPAYIKSFDADSSYESRGQSERRTPSCAQPLTFQGSFTA